MRKLVIEQLEEGQGVFERCAACDGGERSGVDAEGGGMQRSFGDGAVVQVPELRTLRSVIRAWTRRKRANARGYHPQD